MKLQDTVTDALRSFKTAIGTEYRYGIVCNQVASLLGNVKIDTTTGRWKVSAMGNVTQGTQNKGKLPMNNPAAKLFRFGLALDDLQIAGEFELDAELPKECRAWINNLPQSKEDKKPLVEGLVG